MYYRPRWPQLFERTAFLATCNFILCASKPSIVYLCEMQVSKSKIYFITCAMSTKYVESEARVMSLVLIESIAEIKRL